MNEKSKCFVHFTSVELPTIATECRPRICTADWHVVRQMTRSWYSMKRCWQSTCLHCD